MSNEVKYLNLKHGAIKPTKASSLDSGFDVTLIDVVKVIGKVTLYGTGISIQPPTGYYFDLVPRSSIIKSGYMLANSVGIIDQGYTGEIMVPLIKMDNDIPDLELPNKIVQLIPRRWHDLKMIECENLKETERGNGGFGSSG